MVHPLPKVQDPVLIDCLNQFLGEAIEVDGAAFGYIHLYNRVSDALELAVHRGYDETFLAMFKQVRAFDASVCARAYRLGNSVAVGDVSSDPFISQFLSVFVDRGIYAMQSTPILDPNGAVIGMLSTHFPRNFQPTTKGMVSIKQIASKIADECLEQGLKLQ